MVEIEFQQKTKELIDSLKNICATNGLGNNASEFDIITQTFLYKFLSDKFAFEAKKLSPRLAEADKWEDELLKLSDQEFKKLQRRLGDTDTAILQPQHLIAHLFTKQNEPDFAKLFDDTLIDIAKQNNDVFAVMTDTREKVQLFTRISESVTVSKRDAFCRAVINKIAEFSFERIFTQKFDFYATIFEYLVKDYNSNSGSKYAEYYTPHAVARIMAEILVPKEQQGKVKNVSCYDPSAGSGTLLMNVAHAIGESRCSIFTQDISKKSSNLLRLNLILNNLVHSIPNVIEGDTLRHPHHKSGASLKQFDYIVSNPPFKLDFSDIRDELDGKEHKERFFAGVPNVPNKDLDKMKIYLLFLQHIIHSLKQGGKAAVVVPTGFISAKNGIEHKIIKKLIDDEMLAGVVSMPSNIFATTGTNVSIIFIDASNKGDVILVDATNLGQQVKDGKNKKTLLSTDEELRITDVFNTKESQEGFSIAVSYKNIAKKRYILSASQYFELKVEYEDITSEQFEERVQCSSSKLDELFDKSSGLEKEIKKQLSSLIYE